MPACPDPDALRRFLAGESPDRAVARHVDLCSACQAALDKLTDGTLSGGPSDVPQDPELTSLLARMRQTVPNRPRAREPVRFPGPPTADAPLGRLGPYRIQRLLGRGATSLVYEAIDGRLGRTVAIKILRPEQAPLGSVRERFEREARALASLRHEHLVAVHDVQTPDDFPWYLVLEHVPGEPLAVWIERGPKPRAAADLVRQAALGLAAAHTAGLVHRDVKPANILIDAQGRARVADFGLVLDAEEADSLTAEGQVIGTPAYMSPEQARGDGRSADARADVWGLGVVLFEALTGRLPFPGRGRDVMAQVLNDDPPPPRSLRPGLSADLEAIVLKCLERDPADRYPSAGELADDLGRYLDGEAVRARRPGPAARLARWARRHRAGLTVAGLIAVLLLAAGFVWWARRSVDAVQARNDVLSLETRAGQFMDDGEDEQAEPLLRRALDLATRLCGAHPALHGDCARLCQRLGELHDDRDEEDEAEALFRRAVDHADKAADDGPASRQALASALLRLVESLEGRFPPEEWRPFLERFTEVQGRLWERGEGDADGLHRLHAAYLQLVASPDGKQLQQWWDAASNLLDRAEARATTDDARGQVLLLRARAGREPEALAALAERIVALGPDDRMMALRAACCYGLCLRRVPPGEGRERYERLALEHLGRAVRLGLDDPMLLRDDALDPISRHPEFRKIRRQMR